MTTISSVSVAAYAREAGFRGQDLITATAISFAEDQNHDTTVRYRPGTGEDSWGLWQINVGGEQLWLDRQRLARQHDYSLVSPNQLGDPAFNALMAFWLRTRRGSFADWSTYLDRAYLQHMSAAAAAVAQLSSGAFHLTRYLLLANPMQSGHDVALWQQVCGAKPDGIFGPLTKSATVAWQARHHDTQGRPLAADGVVGPLTATAAGWIWSGR